jgi:hypothetical protein
MCQARTSSGYAIAARRTSGAGRFACLAIDLRSREVEIFQVHEDGLVPRDAEQP